MKKIIFTLFISSLMFGKTNVVASTTDLADIAKTIGGNRVSVISIATGKQDHHHIEVLPSYMLKVKKADIYLKVGLELDLWANQIIDGSRNRKLTIVNCSENILPLEVPTTKIDASMGDIHRMGNPHYWLDPENGKIIAENITKALISVDPAGRELFEINLNKFKQDVDNSLADWLQEFNNLRGRKLIYYHNSWPYFDYRFGLKAVQFIEPKPGIMPSPTHLDRLIHLIKTDKIKLIGMETYFSDKAPKFLAGKTGIKIIRLAQSVNALPGTESYLKMIRYNLETISNAFEAKSD
ncbi:MAG: zinc ABC transporter solute-binding protein [Planctomycetia bacterium]|nr:zinc ABC transporter solute-binding protein [Planctomycetia bacterium]